MLLCVFIVLSAPWTTYSLFMLPHSLAEHGMLIFQQLVRAFLSNPHQQVCALEKMGYVELSSLFPFIISSFIFPWKTQSAYVHVCALENAHICWYHFSLETVDAMSTSHTDFGSPSLFPGQEGYVNLLCIHRQQATFVNWPPLIYRLIISMFSQFMHPSNQFLQWALKVKRLAAGAWPSHSECLHLCGEHRVPIST